MSIDWPTIKSEISSLIADIGSISSKQVIWVDEAQGATWQQEPAVYLRISSVVRVGIEEERLTSSPQGLNQTVNVCGQRQFTLSIRAESFEQNVASDNFAGNLIDRIAIRIMRSTSIARLTSCAVSTRQPTRWFNYKSDKRQVSAYIADFIMLTVDNDIDTSADAGGWIGEAVISGTVKDAPGNVSVVVDVNTLT